jgi:hypothetical protein
MIRSAVATYQMHTINVVNYILFVISFSSFVTYYLQHPSLLPPDCFECVELAPPPAPAATSFIQRIFPKKTTQVYGAKIVSIANSLGVHCNKKVSGFPVPRRGVTYQTLPGRE